MFPVERVLHGDHLVINAEMNLKGLCRLRLFSGSLTETMRTFFSYFILENSSKSKCFDLKYFI